MTNKIDNRGGKRDGVGRPRVSDSHLHQRCWSADKLRWQEQAQAEGLTQSEWVIKTLNAACTAFNQESFNAELKKQKVKA